MTLINKVLNNWPLASNLYTPFCHVKCDVASICDIRIMRIHMSLRMRKPTIWVPTRSDTNRPVQSQKHAGSLKFWI